MVASPIQNEQITRMVIFTLGDEFYCVDAAMVQEIRRMEVITPIPRTFDYLLGVVNLRSQVIPVMCLRRRFGLPEAERTKTTRIMVVECGGIKMGVLVDAVLEVAKISPGEIDVAPSSVAGKGDFISGVYRHGQQLTVILDVSVLMPGKGSSNELQG